jgi:hypothetical protein
MVNSADSSKYIIVSLVLVLVFFFCKATTASAYETPNGGTTADQQVQNPAVGVLAT